MIASYFAHAGEEHNDTVTAAAHWLENPSNAVLVWIGLVVVLLLVANKALKLSRPNTLLALASLNLVYGVYLYNKAPVVGAIALTVGFAATLWTVIIGLGAEPATTHGRRTNGKRKK